MTATTADKTAALFNNDGQCWERPGNSGGFNLLNTCAAASTDIERNEHHSLTRYAFSDGSAILIADGGWQIAPGGAECWCWGETCNCLDPFDQAEHDEGSCPECGTDGEHRTCDDCGKTAYIVDCGCYSQPRPISTDETGNRMLCDDCAN
jgi:hypothetical protein